MKNCSRGHQRACLPARGGYKCSDGRRAPVPIARFRIRLTARPCRSRTERSPIASCATPRPAWPARSPGRRRVAVLAEPRIETAVAVIGALPAGVPVVPVNPNSGAAELAHIVSDAEPEALLVAPGQPLPDAVRGQDVIEVDLDAPGDEALRGADPVAVHDPEAPALIVYTSGTTGPPKGAVLPRRAIASNLDALAERVGMDRARRRRARAAAVPRPRAGDRHPRAAAPRRDGACTSAASPRRRSAPRCARDGATVAVRRADHVPAPGRRRRGSTRAGRGAGRRAAAGVGLGGAARRRARAAAALTGRGVVERYGMTETLMNTAHPRRRRARARARSGRRCAGVELRLVDDDGRDARGLATGRRSARSRCAGRTCSSATSTAPTRPRRRCTTAGLRTGDMATRDARGYIRIVGRRATDLIKSGGYKIGAGEIEAALREHPGVEDAAVTGEPDDDLGERVVAWVVLRDGARPGADELVDHVAVAAGAAQAPAHGPLPGRAAAQRARQGAEAASGRVTERRRPRSTGRGSDLARRRTARAGRSS